MICDVYEPFNGDVVFSGEYENWFMIEGMVAQIKQGTLLVE